MRSPRSRSTAYTSGSCFSSTLGIPDHSVTKLSSAPPSSSPLSELCSKEPGIHAREKEESGGMARDTISAGEAYADYKSRTPIEARFPAYSESVATTQGVIGDKTTEAGSEVEQDRAQSTHDSDDFEDTKQNDEDPGGGSKTGSFKKKARNLVTTASIVTRASRLGNRS